MLSGAWPGAQRRDPPASSATWVVRSALARWLREEAERLARAGTRVRILDVGCGPKPYYPFFADVAAEYVGLDVVPTPSADVVGVVEEMPLEIGTVRPRPLHAGARALRRPGPRRLGAAAGDGARRPRARLDARRAGLSPLSARLLALDARGSREALPGATRSGRASASSRPQGRPRRSRCSPGRSSRSGSRRAHVPGARARAGVGAEQGRRGLDAVSRCSAIPFPGALIANLHVTADVHGSSSATSVPRATGGAPTISDGGAVDSDGSREALAERRPRRWDGGGGLDPTTTAATHDSSIYPRARARR